VTVDGRAIAELFRRAFQGLDELEKQHPDEVETLLRSFVAHVRSWKPTILQVPERPEVADAAR
jgi:hypothetical protein